MGSPEVAIIGLGPAGSLLAWKAAEAGYRVRGYDLQARYGKPCGDAVIVVEEYEGILRGSGSIAGTVSRHIVEVAGYRGRVIEHRGPAWYIVDKPRLVSYLRGQAAVHGAEIVKAHGDPYRVEAGVVVDARGPYAHVSERGSYLVALRLLVEVDSWGEDTALLRFDPRGPGLIWVFPSHIGGSIVNAGGGYKGVGVEDVRRRVLGYLKERFKGPLKILEEKAAPVAVYSRVEPAAGGVIRLGEAGGLINSVGGEGFRMALLSALRAYESLQSPDPARRYARLTEPLARESLLTRRLLRAVEGLEAGEAGRLLHGLPPVFWRGFLEGRMSYRLLARSLIARPQIGLRALRALLSSPS